MHLVLRRGFETKVPDSSLTRGLNGVENENEINAASNILAKKDGITGSNNKNRKGLLNCLWRDPGKLINGYVNFRYN